MVSKLTGSAANFPLDMNVRMRDTPAASYVDPQNAGDGIKILGSGVKALVQAIDSLVDLGIPSQDLPLPQIVVVGDQSAGKSSVG